ncbi:HNH endonuclease [Paraliobacillus ryukyuensis]|uniref:HNH endonuclease n=1 Tax=Paraliobacillus ryukyuensis TaxID=200904 RepID=UPI000DEA2C52|nr:HNH endonuclease [Paraliobacillus ryukyuensis]
MAKEYAKRFYKSKAWQQCRASYIRSKFGLCERCSKTGKIVHHIKYITPQNINNPDITLNHSNLELLCQDCHNEEHHYKYSPTRKGFAFDSDGNLIKVG